MRACSVEAFLLLRLITKSIWFSKRRRYRFLQSLVASVQVNLKLFSFCFFDNVTGKFFFFLLFIAIRSLSEKKSNYFQCCWGVKNGKARKMFRVKSSQEKALREKIGNFEINIEREFFFSWKWRKKVVCYFHSGDAIGKDFRLEKTGSFWEIGKRISFSFDLWHFNRFVEFPQS